MYTVPLWDTAYGGGGIQACEIIKTKKKNGEKKTSSINHYNLARLIFFWYKWEKINFDMYIYVWLACERALIGSVTREARTAPFEPGSDVSARERGSRTIP